MNTGRMDTPRPPVRLAVDSMAMQGGNYSQRGEAESRRPHKPEIVGSNPTAATNVMPDRCGYAHQPVGSRPDLGKADAVSQMVVSQNMAPMQRVPNQISHDQAIGQQAPVRAFQWLL